MKGKYLSFLMVALSLALLSNLTPGTASSPQVPRKEVNGTCPQTIFVNTGQAIGNANSLSVALGDLDGDNLPDAVVGNAAGSGVWEEVWLNQGGGTFAFGQTLGENGDTPGMILVDAEGDDDLDIIPAGAGSILFKNNGSGNFSMGQWLNLGYDNAIAVGELANGGLPEVVLSGDGSTTPAQVWFNNGDLFNPYTVGFPFTVSSVVDILVGDVYRDFVNNDVIIVNQNSLGNEVSQVWVNNGDGTFTAGGSVQPTQAHVSAAALGYVDDDPFLDLVLGFDGVETSLEIWRNDGNANFALEPQLLPSESASDLVFANVDGDLDVDLVVSDSSSAQVWLNDGSGIFCLAQDNIGSQVNALAVEDLDGNFSPDLFLVTSTENEVWLNLLTVTDVNLSVSIHGRWFVNENELYSINVTNLSPITATNITVEVDAFPLNSLHFDYVDPRATCSDVTRICTIPSLSYPSMGVFTLYVEFDIDFYGLEFVPAWIRAMVTSAETDSNPANNEAQLDVVVTSCSCIICFLWFNWNNPQDPILTKQALSTPLGGLIDLPLYYSIRDQILSLTISGHSYIDLYYTHDAELQTLILTDPDLLNAAANTLLLWQPNLQALVDGQGDSAIITQEQVDAADGFLDQIYAIASPELKVSIDTELAKLPDPDDFVGMTMEEARGIVVGYGVYLPLVVGQP